MMARQMLVWALWFCMARCAVVAYAVASTGGQSVRATLPIYASASLERPAHAHVAAHRVKNGVAKPVAPGTATLNLQARRPKPRARHTRQVVPRPQAVPRPCDPGMPRRQVSSPALLLNHMAAAGS